MSFNGLSIIIPTKDRGTVFYKTLDAAYRASLMISAEIIVINDSKSNLLVIDTKYEYRVKIIDNIKSGVASARNLGAKHAKYSHFLFLDDDILITSNNIADLIQDIGKYPNAAINFNWTYPLELTEQIKKTQFGRYLIKNGFTSLKGWSSNLKWVDTEIFQVDLIASYFLCISKDNFNIVGGYNELFPHAGAEDFEFAMRLKNNGIIGLCNPFSIVWHNEEDRVELLPWIQRKERAAETRRIAVNMGYNELAINVSNQKIKFVKLLYYLKSVLFIMLEIIPNRSIFDKLYFKVVNNLLMIYLYKGYFKNSNA